MKTVVFWALVICHVGCTSNQIDELPLSHFPVMASVPVVSEELRLGVTIGLPSGSQLVEYSLSDSGKFVERSVKQFGFHAECIAKLEGNEGYIASVYDSDPSIVGVPRKHLLFRNEDGSEEVTLELEHGCHQCHILPSTNTIVTTYLDPQTGSGYQQMRCYRLKKVADKYEFQADQSRDLSVGGVNLLTHCDSRKGLICFYDRSGAFSIWKCTATEMVEISPGVTFADKMQSQSGSIFFDGAISPNLQNVAFTFKDLSIHNGQVKTYLIDLPSRDLKTFEYQGHGKSAVTLAFGPEKLFIREGSHYTEYDLMTGQMASRGSRVRVPFYQDLLYLKDGYFLVVAHHEKGVNVWLDAIEK